MSSRFPHIFAVLLSFVLLDTGSECLGLEINDQFAISGVLAGAYQHQDIDSVKTGRGSVPMQLELAYTPDHQNTFSAKFGFASGNALNGAGSFALSPWAADLENDVRDIHGSGRDYLLTAWYRHTIEFASAGRLSVTGGIIDATDYLDDNAYANDEYTQFMNEALVNGPNGFVPSYDIGGALTWEAAGFSAAGVLMHITENDAGFSYNFYGLQLGYALAGPTIQGNYRLMLGTTSNDFELATGESDPQNLKCAMLSLDQQLSAHLGVWLRLGTQDDAAAISYKHLYSGGFNVGGSLWGRDTDNAGIAFAYLYGGNSGLDSTQVFETYVRFGINDYLAFSMDIQYMNDDYFSSETIDGFIYSIRATAEI